MYENVQIPAWVPPAVKSIAEALDFDGGNIGRRLLTKISRDEAGLEAVTTGKGLEGVD